MLDEHKIPYLAVDSDADLVARERKNGLAVYYGDAANAEFLKRCGLAEAPRTGRHHGQPAPRR